MIMFDYGQTLVWETPYDLTKTFNGILNASLTKPDGITPEIITNKFQQLRSQLHIDKNSNQEPEIRHLFRYMAEFFGLEFDFDYRTMEELFWKGAVEFGPTPGIENLLTYLEEHGIRTAVISNLDYREETLNSVIRENIPNAMFEFTIATSEYMFRKPFPEIFELAIIKSGLKPNEIWYVGNDAVYDVEGSYNAGLFPLWYKGSPYFTIQPEPDCPYLEINHWNDLIKALENSKL